MEDQKNRIHEIRKCVKDIVYFAENYYTSANLTGIQKMPLFKSQKRVLKGMVKNQNIVTNGARQVGLTTLNGVYALWEATFFSDNTIVLMSHKMQSAQTIMERVKMAYEKMPNWIKPELEVYNKNEIRFKNGSSIRVSTATSSACRGMTVNTLIVDDAAFIPERQMEEMWNSLVPVISSSAHNKIILTSCPHGCTGKFAEMCKYSRRSSNNWHYDIIKWNDVPGRGKAWKSNMIKCMGQEAFKREFQCEFI
jgi:hypothetical protein